MLKECGFILLGWFIAECGTNIISGTTKIATGIPFTPLSPPESSPTFKEGGPTETITLFFIPVEYLQFPTNNFDIGSQISGKQPSIKN